MVNDPSLQLVDERPVIDPEDGHGDPGMPEAVAAPGIEEAPKPWRAAEALRQLRRQVDAAFPGRVKANDGTVGDAAHQSRASDHNPWIDDGEGHAGQRDWSLARTLWRFEGYNGFGYYPKGINSPYLWSFSNHYTKGKFVRDGVYDPAAVSKQCGAAAMLRALIDAGDVGLPG